MEQLPHIPDIERLSPLVVRVLGGNPGKFTLQGTNTYLVGRGPKRLLIDTGEGRPAWKEALRRALAAENAGIEAIILTHGHADHVGGVADARALAGADVAVWKNDSGPGQRELRDGHVLAVDGATLRAVHTPGHTRDHTALLLLEEDALFTGDCVLGHGTAVFDDLPAYLASLHRLARLFAGRAYPAHGALIPHGPAALAHYIAHRAHRESQLCHALRRPPPPAAQGWSSMQLVHHIYAAHPAHLWPPAEHGVRQILAKLEREGKVAQTPDGSWRVVSGTPAS